MPYAPGNRPSYEPYAKTEKAKKALRSSSSMFATEEQFDSVILAKSELAARAADAREQIGLIASARAERGASFTIPNAGTRRSRVWRWS